VPSIPESLSPERPLAGERVAITGKMVTLSRRDIRAIVERLGGEVIDDGAPGATVVVGDYGPLQASDEHGIRCLNEAVLCELAGLPSSDALRAQFKTSRDIRGMYPAIRDEHLRFFEKWGLVHPVAGRFYGFTDLQVIRQAAAELAGGTPLQAVVRSLSSTREGGQMMLDFQSQPRRREHPTQQARVVTLARRTEPPPALFPVSAPMPGNDEALAARYFMEGARLDDGTEENQDAAISSYRRALIVDPDLVPALVNLANIHYARDSHIEAMALYERALTLEPDCFEAHFNLGNVHHDLGRFEDALVAYREAVALNPGYPEAHFYLAVTLEKMGRSPDAKPHWKLYRELAPEGEWAELAKEFE
jgi:tetratricopeptide (TPR) repeat protein